MAMGQIREFRATIPLRQLFPCQSLTKLVMRRNPLVMAQGFQLPPWIRVIVSSQHLLPLKLILL
jgi:hypothetical protein